MHNPAEFFMDQSKDIRFSDKKVDESWKEQIDRDRSKAAPASQTPSSQAASSAQAPASRPTQELPSSPEFLNLVNTLVYQALFHLGELPEAQGSDVNLDAAREAIELLRALQVKTQGNLSKQESGMLSGALPELQMKFTQHA